MSGKRQILEVEPPPFHDQVEESMVFHGFVCPRCNGNGKVADYGIRETNFVECPRCGGGGRLRANVVVLWVPEKKNDIKIEK